MSTVNNSKILTDLPAVVSVEKDNRIWLHQQFDQTDRNYSLEQFFHNTFDMRPAPSASSVSIGLATDPFDHIYGTRVHVGSAELFETNDVLQTPDAHIDGNLTVTGDVTIMGTTTEIETQEVQISNNFILLNDELDNQTAPPSTLTSGIKVNRGSEVNYQFMFAEDSESFRVGKDGDTQPVATREDAPQDGGIAVWNDTDKRFDTSTNVSGVQTETAERLSTEREIKLTGNATGSVDFDGSDDVEISVTVVDDQHKHDSRYYTKTDSDDRFIRKNPGAPEEIQDDLTVTGDLTVDGKVDSDTFTGNAGTATKLFTARDIQLGNALEGSVSFDGSNPVTIQAVVKDVTQANLDHDTDTDNDGDPRQAHSHDAQYYPRATVDGTFVSIDQTGGNKDEIQGNFEVNGNVYASEFAGPEGASNAIFNGNAETATEFADSMELTFEGDVDGSISFTGKTDKTVELFVSNAFKNTYYTQTQAHNAFLSLGAPGDTDTETRHGNFIVIGQLTADKFIGPLEGNADTATAWENEQDIKFTGDLDGTVSIQGGETQRTWDINVVASSANSIDTIVRRSSSGNFAASRITADTFVANTQFEGSLDGTANKAKELTGPIRINGVEIGTAENDDTEVPSVTEATLEAGTGIDGDNFDGSTGRVWNVKYGNSGGTACEGDDDRLSDTRETKNPLKAGKGLTGDDFTGAAQETWNIDFGNAEDTVAEGNHDHSGLYYNKADLANQIYPPGYVYTILDGGTGQRDPAQLGLGTVGGSGDHWQLETLNTADFGGGTLRFYTRTSTSFNSGDLTNWDPAP